MGLEVVEVLREFRVPDYVVRAGARVLAWQRRDGAWVVCFNGDEVPVAEGTVAGLGTHAAKNNAPQLYSAARLEQYQVAPAKPE